MGIDAVPETVAAAGPFGLGSGQRLVEEDFDFDPRQLFGPELDPILWPVAVLDIVCNNADRKLGHLIKEKAGPRIWAIDNGLTFHPEPKLRTVLWGFAGQRLPTALVEAITRLNQALATSLRNRVAALLSSSEAEVLVKRVAGLLENPVHPHPPDDRPAVPWPLW
jgi:uncharacterized repeat protein (TIGR03843 family)